MSSSTIPTVSELSDEFNRVQKNSTSVFHFLIQLAQIIENNWETDTIRYPYLEHFVKFLDQLQHHKDPNVQEISRIAPKINKNLQQVPLKHFLILVLPIERKYSRGIHDHEFLITRHGKERCTQLTAEGQEESAKTAVKGDSSQILPTESAFASPERKSLLNPVSSSRGHQTLPVVVVIDNMRSAFNLGSIFRTSDCFAVQKLILCGYTATPDTLQVQRTAMGSPDFVAWEFRKDVREVLKEYRGLGTNKTDSMEPRDISVIALETVDNQPLLHQFQFPFKKYRDKMHTHTETQLVLVLGNERFGLEAEILALCTDIVKIQCCGVKNSMNVSVAYGICMYEIYRQFVRMKLSPQGEDNRSEDNRQGFV